MSELITTVAFREQTDDGRRKWVVVGLNKYIAAQGDTHAEAMATFRHILDGMIWLSKERGEPPLSRIKKAPRNLLLFSL